MVVWKKFCIFAVKKIKNEITTDNNIITRKVV